MIVIIFQAEQYELQKIDNSENKPQEQNNLFSTITVNLPSTESELVKTVSQSNLNIINEKTETHKIAEESNENSEKVL